MEVFYHGPYREKSVLPRPNRTRGAATVRAMAAPPATWPGLVLGLSVDPLAALAIAAAGAGYVTGVRRLAARGRSWPRGRSVAFAAGLATAALATQSGIARYGGTRFSAHVAEHLLLGMAAPLLLALAAPATLALQAANGGGRRAVHRLVHSRAAALLTHPAVAALLFGGSLFALWFTPLFELALSNRLAHAAVHVHFVVAGCAFFWPLVGLDPVRRRLPHGARALVVLLLVPLHAVLGLALLGSQELLAGGWYARATGPAAALADQQLGGGLLWVAGDLLGLAASAVVLAQWMAHDERQAARDDRRLDAAAAG